MILTLFAWLFRHSLLTSALRVVAMIREKSERKMEEVEAILLIEAIQSCFRAGFTLRNTLRMVLGKRKWRGSTGWMLPVTIEGCAQGHGLAESIERALIFGRGKPMNSQLECFWRVLQVLSLRGGNAVALSGAFLERVRDAHALRRRVDSLMAQVRFQSFVIRSSPVGVLVFLSLVGGEKIRFLFLTCEGRIVLCVAIALHLAGSIVLLRIEEWASHGSARRRR